MQKTKSIAIKSSEMKLAIFAHCAIDTIMLENHNYEQIGGSACYCGLTAREFKFDVDLFTKFGPDFPKQYFEQNKIRLRNSESDTKTTKFAISISGADRTLKLQHECEPVSFESVDSDGHIVSPIFHEISDEDFKKIKENSNFIFIDPQGFLRRKDGSGNVALADTDMDLSGTNAIKVNPEEAKSIVGDGTHDDVMVALQKKGVEHVLLTDKTNVSLLVKDKIYSITLPNKDVHDTTGIGDIFCSAFTCTMLKEKDFLWALCFAGGAAQAALESKNIGLQKIPSRGKVQSNASYFYNLVKFRDL